MPLPPQSLPRAVCTKISPKRSHPRSQNRGCSFAYSASFGCNKSKFIAPLERWHPCECQGMRIATPVCGLARNDRKFVIWLRRNRRRSYRYACHCEPVTDVTGAPQGGLSCPSGNSPSGNPFSCDAQHHIGHWPIVSQANSHLSIPSPLRKTPGALKAPGVFLVYQSSKTRTSLYLSLKIS